MDLPLDDRALLVERVVAAQPHELQRRDDRRQRIAQLVAEHGEELVLGAVGHLGLGARLALQDEQLPVPLLDALAVGDVEKALTAATIRAVRVIDGRGAGGEDPPRAVGMEIVDLLVEDDLAGERPGQRVLVRPERLGRRGAPPGRRRSPRPSGWAARRAEDRPHALVGQQRAARGRLGDDHSRRHLVHHRLEQLAGGLDLAAGVHLRRDVDGDRHDAEDLARPASRIGWAVNLKKTSSTVPSPSRSSGKRYSSADERLAAGVDPAEHLEDRRRPAGSSGNTSRIGLPMMSRAADHLLVERVGEVVDELGAAQDAHRDRRLHEVRVEPRAGALGLGAQPRDLQARADAGEQLARREGLDQVVVGAGGEPLERASSPARAESRMTGTRARGARRRAGPRAARSRRGPAS